jgi:hypothetical protein
VLGLEEFFKAIAVTVAIRTSSEPMPTKEEVEERIKRARLFAVTPLVCTPCRKRSDLRFGHFSPAL